LRPDHSAFARIKIVPRALDLRQMRERPFAERHHWHREPAPEIGQLVIDPRRDGRKHRARHQAVALQPAQGQRQHPLRDAVDHALQLIEAARSVAQQHDDQHAPFVADPRQHRGHAAAVLMRVWLTRKTGRDGYIDVLGFHWCARVSKMCVLAEI
jgi:hypothetical protein